MFSVGSSSPAPFPMGVVQSRPLCALRKQQGPASELCAAESFLPRALQCVLLLHPVQCELLPSPPSCTSSCFIRGFTLWFLPSLFQRPLLFSISLLQLWLLPPPFSPYDSIFRSGSFSFSTPSCQRRVTPLGLSNPFPSPSFSVDNRAVGQRLYKEPDPAVPGPFPPPPLRTERSWGEAPPLRCCDS